MGPREIMKMLKKRWNLIVAVFVGSIVASIISTSLITPTYEAEVVLRVRPPKQVAGALVNALAAANDPNNKPSMSTYAEVIKSHTVLQSVVDKLRDQGGKTITYDALAGRIVIQPVKDTELLKIKVQSSSPQEAKVAANLLVETFNERMSLLNRTEEKTAKEFIGERLTEAKQELERAEDALLVFKRDQRIVAPTEEIKYMTERFSTVNLIAARNDIEIAAALAKVSSVNRQLGGESPGVIADSRIVQQYKSKLADLEVEQVGLLQKYTTDHPKVSSNQAMIEEARSKLAEEIDKILKQQAPSDNQIHHNLLQSKITAEVELNAARAQQEAINKVLMQNDQELSQLPAKEQGLTKVMRDVQLAQEMCVMLSKRYEEARISEIMQPTDVQVIDWATVPEYPIKPQKVTNVMVAAIFGLVSALVLCFILEFMNRTIRTAADVKRYLDLLLLGIIPTETAIEINAPIRLREKLKNWLHMKKGWAFKPEPKDELELVVSTRPVCQVSEAYRTVGNSLHFLQVERRFKTLLVTGIESGERNSAVVANLALTLAQAGKRVLLIDFDLRKPLLHKIFSVENTGITDIFFDGAQLSNVIKGTENKNLKLLPAGTPLANASELLWNIQAFIESFKSEYDYVLLDAPSVMGVADSCMLASKVDGVVLVIDAEGNTRTDLLQRGKEMLLKAGGQMIGVILNRAENNVERFYRHYSGPIYDMDDIDIRR